MIRALIVDDEPPARSQVREFLSNEVDVAVVGESGDGQDAVRQIRLLDPDLVFMDIRMPRMTGLEVLRSGESAKTPYTIFTTAYAGYAVDAFTVDALDYLVKPLERRRFRQAIERARRYLARDAALLCRIDSAALQAFIANLEAAGAQRGRFPVRTGRRTQILDLTSIEYVEADGDYAAIHHGGGAVLRTRESIAALQARLPAARFARVHRSVIINLDCVREVRSNKRGGLSLVTSSGHRLVVGAKYGDAVRAIIID